MEYFLFIFVTFIIMVRHTDMTDSDDIIYIRQIKNGNADAFGHIVQRYQRMVLTIVSRIITNSDDAEDVAQEIFIQVFQSIHKFREESEFGTWLYRIAYNTTISHIRKRKHEFTAIDDNFDNIPDGEINDSIDSVSTEQQLQYLDIVLSKLPPEDAMIITMFYLNSQSIQDISTITDLSVANVKVKLHRIRKFMNFEINKLIWQ